ncbi:sulfhydryl oxidase 2-like isoform X2 [Mercenaria mercenaria]|uniref:sulfhydryl oxidase 2-like isoform X2 n=1 Tax=Mercenaria mercenaria TaxID=6596 RepID=UPI00234EB30B|nr:sulfhydryl oxidase 2-like isoform X2 [Mercenaria mercenaria]
MKWIPANYSIVFVHLLCFFGCVDCKVKAEGLYKPSGSVFILDQQNFRQNVIKSESAWIVEFYNSWCGHCIKFAPAWKEFGLKHEDWWPVFRVGAVDCANDNNTELCRSYDITGFPAFKLFPPGYKGIDTGGTFHDQDTASIENRCLDYVSNTSLFKPPKSWPRLSPIQSMQDIWNETKDEHHHVAFVFEEPTSYVGRQVILDTYRYKPLLVRRMLKESVLKFGISEFPSLFLINRDGTFTKIAKDDNSRDGMVSGLKNLLTSAQLKAGDQFLNKRPRNQPIEERMEGIPVADNQQIRPAVYMKDLESTLHYSLRQEIAICRDIGGEKLKALKQFMSVLAKYFPGREEVSDYLFKVSAWLRSAGSDITGDQWITALDDKQSMEEFLPERIEWVGCAGSEARFRGYPCGMWTLFHTLTVAAYQKGRANPKDVPLDVLSAIQGYMKYFFGCQICVEHFLKMVDFITPDDRTPEGAVMWLWRAHNMANKRLHGDQSEDPKHPKIQFPSKKLCPECRNGDNWSNDKVLEFLLSFYARLNIVPVADDSNEEEVGRTSKSADNDSNKLDWWELQQRKNDLEKIRSLRQQKSEKRQNKKVALLLKMNLINLKKVVLVCTESCQCLCIFQI